MEINQCPRLNRCAPLLAARAATDPNAARLLEMFDRANEVLDRSPYKYGDVEIFQPVKS
jgi:hypothetical protein